MVLLYIFQTALPLIAILILYFCFYSLFGNLSDSRVLITLYDSSRNICIPVLYWENSIGRHKHCDIVINSPLVTRDHAVLYRRDEGWFIADTNSKMGVFLNGRQIEKAEKVLIGDRLRIGDRELVLKKGAYGFFKRDFKKKRRLRSKEIPSAFMIFLTNIFHLIASLQLSYSEGNWNKEPLILVSIIVGISWIYYFIFRFLFRRVNFELEILGLFLSGIGIINSYSVSSGSAYTQLFALTIGVIFFSCITFFIQNPDFAMKCRIYVAGLAVILLIVNLIFGQVKNGSQNWIMLGNISLQPSEFVKVMFVFFGASTLYGLQTAKNLTGFILFSCTCMGALFLMGDFGTACIFFVAFIVIAFMRSGSIRTIFLILVSAGIGLTFILKFKPYVVNRFSAWRHVWEHVNDIGYQQTRVLAYSASGGLLGMGVGRGCLKYIFAAPRDLVFGMLCEEWGLILSLLIIISIGIIGVYARLCGLKSRSTFYSISSCAAAAIILFQMMMNVFGSIDIFPLTGVTLPFVSLGGSSLISTWGLLAFIKASDERTYGIKK